MGKKDTESVMKMEDDVIIGPLFKAIEGITPEYWRKYKHLRFMSNAVRGFEANLRLEFSNSLQLVEPPVEEVAKPLPKDKKEK